MVIHLGSLEERILDILPTRHCDTLRSLPRSDAAPLCSQPDPVWIRTLHSLPTVNAAPLRSLPRARRFAPSVRSAFYAQCRHYTTDSAHRNVTFRFYPLTSVDVDYRTKTLFRMTPRSLLSGPSGIKLM